MRKNGNEQELQHAKQAYKAATEVGNRKEEARWANIIGNIFKNRGEYVKALEWIRKDYEVSERFLPEKDILPTCNTLGELHLRLQNFKEALHYQVKKLLYFPLDELYVAIWLWCLEFVLPFGV